MRVGRPWGLSGPEFLELYGLALVGLVVLCVVVWLLPRLGRAGRDRANQDHAEVGPYELALLNGGTGRVADAALAGLLEARKVRINRMRHVSVHTTEEKGPADEFQQVVVDHLRGRTTMVGMLRGVRRALRRSGLCEPLERGLRERGLIVSAGARRLVFGLLALFPLLGVIGVVRAVHGAALGYPVGFLLVELVVTLVTWGLLARLLAHPQRTAAGEAARHVDLTPSEDLETAGPSSARPQLGRPSGRAATRVASRGFGEYPDKRLAGLLRPTRSGGGAGAGFGGSSGGGCGGGGGGGCGGGGA